MKSAKLPVACLLFMSPLIGEYLLGSLPASMIALLPLMMALYGAGALLIRETVRATGRGWASLVLLAIAYGLFEEGFITQSLFNPDYLHLRLLDFGYLPVLGTALPWALFVVSIHVVWSIAVPVALIESAFPERRDQAWLGTWGRAGYALALLAGAALIAVFTYKQVPFMASPLQLGAVGALIAASCIVAIKLPRTGTALSPCMPPVILVFLASFLAGSAFMLAGRRAQTAWHLGWMEVVALSLGIEALFVVLVHAWTRGGRWDEPRRFALTAGGFLVYAWIGFETDISLHGRSDLVGHSLIAGLLCMVLVIVGVRVARRSRAGC